MTDITPFANRLGKNIKHLMKWAKRNNIEAWRIYDRDIPQFPLPSMFTATKSTFRNTIPAG